MVVFPKAPEDIKPVQHYMKLAADLEERNFVIAYYARMAATYLALKIYPNEKPPEVSAYLSKIMTWLEETKKEKGDIEGISNETVGIAIIEEYILQIYKLAYNSDCNSKFNRNMVKYYYTTTLLCDILRQFGPLSEDMEDKYRVSKYRAAYLHNMLKKGIKPLPINCIVVDSEEEEQKYLLTLDQLNERRVARGEEPLPKPKPKYSGPIVRLPDPVEEPKENMVQPVEIIDTADLTEMPELIDRPPLGLYLDPYDPFTAALYHYRKLHPLEDPNDERPKGPRNFFKPTYPEANRDFEDPDDDIWSSIKPKSNVPTNPSGPSVQPPPNATSGPSVSPMIIGEEDEEEAPGNVPTNLPSTPTAGNNTPASTSTLGSGSSQAASLDPDSVEKAMKYCQWASSALNFDDINTAIVNLEKALNMCKFGKDSS